jgi:hypothetical protein
VIQLYQPNGVLIPAVEEPRKEISTQPSHNELISAIAEAARDPRVDAAKMRALWELKKEIDAQEAKNSFQRAMQAVQDEIKPIVRDVEVRNKHGELTNKYARLESIDRMIRPVYTKHGFSLTFGARAGDGGTLVISCDCMHRDGFVKNYELPSKLDTPNLAKNDIQALGSTVTYLRRYLTCLIFNVVLANEDNDGAGAPEMLSEEQRNRILDILVACEEFDKNAQKGFLNYMRVDRMEDIPAARYVEAITALQSKMRKRK